MKIYFIGQKGIPTVGGGVENYVDNLAVRLAKTGHDVYVYTRWNYTNKNKRQYKGVKLINLPSLPLKNFDTISHTILAVFHVLFRKADVIHFHSIGPSSLLWLPKILKFKTAIVATFQSQCYLHKKWNILAQAYLRFGEFILCTFADAIIVPSKILQNRAKNIYGRESILIPNGVSFSYDKKSNLLKKLGLKKDDYFLAVSRLVKHKGLHYLIEAYNNLKTDKKLVIVGGSAYTDDYVREIKDLAIQNSNIIFAGARSGKILQQLFHNAYAFIQPSESEGLSIALLEAMSHKLPIIASDIEENCEVINGVGFLFKNKNIDDLKINMRYVQNYPKKAKNIGRLAYLKAKKNYDWDKLFNEVFRIYENYSKKEKRAKINIFKKNLHYNSFKN